MDAEIFFVETGQNIEICNRDGVYFVINLEYVVRCLSCGIQLDWETN